MSLTLTIISRQRELMGSQAVKVLQGDSASIGRLPGSDWVLQDGAVSRLHACIERRGGEYLLTDKSSNGTYLNDSPNPIGYDRSQRLESGDQIIMGDYVIRVSIDPTVAPNVPPPIFVPPGPASYPAPPSTPAPAQPHQVPWDPPPPPVPPQVRPESFPWDPQPSPQGVAGGLDPSGPIIGGPTEETDPLEIMTSTDVHQPVSPQPFNRQDGYQQPVLRPAPQDEGFQVPPAQPPKEGTQWRPDSISGPSAEPPQSPPGPQSSPPMPPAPVHQPPSTPAAPGGQELERLLVAAGLQPDMARAASRDPQLAEVLGQMLHVLLAGMIEVLRARTKIKNEFRLTQTQISAHHNNPLKLSVDARHALNSLFVSQGPGFLGPVEAVDEGFQNIKSHQYAMLVGMRAAFDSMIKQFDPAELQRQFDRSGKVGGMLANSKAQYWDLLSDLYADITEDSAASYQRLFGEEFAKAYEQQMQRMAPVRRR